MTVEEALRILEGKAALVRYLASSATNSSEIPEPSVWAGMGDVCGEMEELARGARRALDVEALEIEIARTLSRP